MTRFSLFLLVLTFFASVPALTRDRHISDFHFREVISDNLPASAEGYSAASCSGRYVYNCPSGYTRVSCRDDYPLGSHNTCATCIVARVLCVRADLTN